MTYRVTAIDPIPYEALFDADAETLARHGAERVVATRPNGFPCRVSLTDAAVGDDMLLVHHISNAIAGPFRMSHAIYVGKGARQADAIVGALPDMIDRRTIGLRAFDGAGALVGAQLAAPGDGDAALRVLFARSEVAYIHAHNAAYGCYLAAVERFEK